MTDKIFESFSRANTLLNEAITDAGAIETAGEVFTRELTHGGFEKKSEAFNQALTELIESNEKLSHGIIEYSINFLKYMTNDQVDYFLNNLEKIVEFGTNPVFYKVDRGSVIRCNGFSTIYSSLKDGSYAKKKLMEWALKEMKKNPKWFKKDYAYMNSHNSTEQALKKLKELDTSKFTATDIEKYVEEKLKREKDTDTSFAANTSRFD